MLSSLCKFTGQTATPSAIKDDKPSWPRCDTFVDVVAFDCLCVPVADLGRSIGFYRELFALRVVTGGADAGRAVLSRGGRVRLALYRYSGKAVIPFSHIEASVGSLEAARDMVWALGIDVLRDLGEGEVADGGEESFAIADPDRHEIRFVERSHR